jgi:hypothetical protein
MQYVIGWFFMKYFMFRRTDEGIWKATNETYNPNYIRGIAPSLASLPRLHTLDCSGADLPDLTLLAGLTALQSLNCERTPRQFCLESIEGRQESGQHTAVLTDVLAKVHQERCHSEKEIPLNFRAGRSPDAEFQTAANPSV